MSKTIDKEISVWDVSTRWFHWINVICILVLTMIGLIMMYKPALGIVGMAAKIGLKKLHVIVGYVFAINLSWRIIMGFFGSYYNRWSTLLSFKRGDGAALVSDINAIRTGKTRTHTGHTPLGRIAVIMMYLLLLAMAVSGLIRAGTDIYYPPLGSLVAHYVAKPGVSSDALIPYDMSQVNEQRFVKLTNFKKPLGKIHYYGFYLLMLLIVVHIFSVVYTEIRGSRIISAMFTGKKLVTDDD